MIVFGVINFPIREILMQIPEDLYHLPYFRVPKSIWESLEPNKNIVPEQPRHQENKNFTVELALKTGSKISP